MAESATKSALRQSAQFLLKQKYGRYLLYSMLLSLGFHIIADLAFPSFAQETQARQETTMESIELPPEVVIPPPPKALAKPSIPLEAQEELQDDITIDETTPPPPDLIPEAPVTEAKQEGEEFLLVAEVMPKAKFMPPKPQMPPYIARARVDVITKIEFFVTKTGDVDPNRTKITVSSGYPELDEIAVEWAKKIKFHPALNRGEPVSVRVAIPIKWSTK